MLETLIPGYEFLTIPWSILLLEFGVLIVPDLIPMWIGTLVLQATFAFWFKFDYNYGWSTE